MMIHMKRSLFCLVLLCCLSLPLSASSAQASNLLIATNHHAADACLSSMKEAYQPPKKKTKKKKRGNPLDSKRKMKNGRTCPSF